MANIFHPIWFPPYNPLFLNIFHVSIHVQYVGQYTAPAQKTFTAYSPPLPHDAQQQYGCLYAMYCMFLHIVKTYTASFAYILRYSCVTYFFFFSSLSFSSSLMCCLHASKVRPCCVSCFSGSLSLPRLPILPSQYYSTEPGNWCLLLLLSHHDTFMVVFGQWQCDYYVYNSEIVRHCIECADIGATYRSYVQCLASHGTRCQNNTHFSFFGAAKESKLTPFKHLSASSDTQVGPQLERILQVLSCVLFECHVHSVINRWLKMSKNHRGSIWWQQYEQLFM